MFPDKKPERWRRPLDPSKPMLWLPAWGCMLVLYPFKYWASSKDAAHIIFIVFGMTHSGFEARPPRFGAGAQRLMSRCSVIQLFHEPRLLFIKKKRKKVQIILLLYIVWHIKMSVRSGACFGKCTIQMYTTLCSCHICSRHMPEKAVLNPTPGAEFVLIL